MQHASWNSPHSQQSLLLSCYLWAFHLQKGTCHPLSHDANRELAKQVVSTLLRRLPLASWLSGMTPALQQMKGSPGLPGSPRTSKHAIHLWDGRAIAHVLQAHPPCCQLAPLTGVNLNPVQNVQHRQPRRHCSAAGAVLVMYKGHDLLANSSHRMSSKTCSNHCNHGAALTSAAHKRNHGQMCLMQVKQQVKLSRKVGCKACGIPMPKVLSLLPALAVLAAPNAKAAIMQLIAQVISKSDSVSHALGIHGVLSETFSANAAHKGPRNASWWRWTTVRPAGLVAGLVELQNLLNHTAAAPSKQRAAHLQTSAENTK